jgi:hypothetical protein
MSIFFLFFSNIALLLHLLLPYNTYYIALFVFFGSIPLNIWYFKIYTPFQNLIRLPYETLFHILPFVLVKRPTTKKEHIQSLLTFIIALSLYLFYIKDIDLIEMYMDPLKKVGLVFN